MTAPNKIPRKLAELLRYMDLTREALVTCARDMNQSFARTPDNSKSVEESLQSLERSRAQLRQTLIDNSDIDLTAIRRPHPLLGDLDLYQWALFVAQHEERHRRQMEKALAEATERAAECAPIV